MNKSKVLSVDGKVKAMPETENWGKGGRGAGVCREFGLVNSTNKAIWKNRTKIISAFEQKG